MGKELQRFLQLHQRQVVLVGEEVVLWMNLLPLDGALHVGMGLAHGREVVLTHADANLLHQQAGGYRLMFNFLGIEHDQVKKMTQVKHAPPPHFSFP